MISTRQILGIQFFNGTVEEAIASMDRRGGFLIAPSGTCFARLREDAAYRRAVVSADLAIADSGLMVVLWRLREACAMAQILTSSELNCQMALIRTWGSAVSGFLVGSGSASVLPARFTIVHRC